MLRSRLTDGPENAATATWRVSVGTAGVLGLSHVRMDAVPTTAYLLLGSRCSRNCAFCAQARDSSAADSALSRVHWPPFPVDQVIERVSEAHDSGHIRRACFQVTVSPGYMDMTLDGVSRIHSHSAVPVCASVFPRSQADVAALLDAGAERVTIALDAATQRQYAQVKGGHWETTSALLASSALGFPGHVGTHLIVGLGETEKEMTDRIDWCLQRGIRVGLFAFTPIVGTRMQGRTAPSLLTYRRIQAALYLLARDFATASAMRFGSDGEIRDYGLPRSDLTALLANGDAFRTSGCPDCNRPYYNERPGGVIYNYPRPLTPREAECEITALLASLDI